MGIATSPRERCDARRDRARRQSRDREKSVAVARQRNLACRFRDCETEYNRTHALSCKCARHSTVEPTSSNVFLNRQEEAKLADKVQEKILVERF